MNPDLLLRNEGNLLTDETFINYCLQNNTADVAYWENFISSNPDKKDDIGELRDFVLATAQHSKQIDWEEQWQSFKYKVETREIESQLNPQPKYRPMFKWLAAASVVAAIALGILWHQHSSKQKPDTSLLSTEIVLSTKKGEKKTLKLPDSTTINLNSDSHLILSAGFNKTNRTVTLDGEAYFDVAHDTTNQFIVKTQHGDIKDIGTSFNVRNYSKDNVMETTLIKGMVEITLNDQSNKKITLAPSQKFVIKNGRSSLAGNASRESSKEKISIEPVILKDSLITEISWMDNKLFFVNKPLSEIANELERQFDVQIVFNTTQSKNYHYTGFFENQSLDEIMKILKLSKDINYSVQGKELIIE